MDTKQLSSYGRFENEPREHRPNVPGLEEMAADPLPLFRRGENVDIADGGVAVPSGPPVAEVGPQIRALETSSDDSDLGARAAAAEGAVAFVHFDPSSAKSNEMEALVHRDDLARIDRGLYVRIESAKDGRRYVGRIVDGPFFDPDVLKRDSTPVQFIIMNQGHGKVLSLPEYHGRATVELLGEQRSGTLHGIARRPHPGSPIFPFDESTMSDLLNLRGDMRLGDLDGYDKVPVLLDTDDKNTLPRNLLTVGTVGSGKSNTNQVVMEETVAAGWAGVVLDPEGEFAMMNFPVDGAGVAEELQKFEREPQGISNFVVYRPPNCDSKSQAAKEFAVPFESLSPDLIAEITRMNDVQRMRFTFLYDQAVTVIRKETGHSEQLGETEDADISRGYPGMTLDRLIAMLNDEFAHWEHKRGRSSSSSTKKARSGAKETPEVATEEELVDDADSGFYCRIHKIPPLFSDHQDVVSYGALRKKLRELKLTQIFDRRDAPSLEMTELSSPGRLSVIDLSDCDDVQVRNIVIADLLARMYRYKMSLTEEQNAGRKVMLTIEEAHGFVSKENSGKMSETLGQLQRVARRGRKRWLALHFVTQSPQHLPNELFELANNKIIHQTTGAENLRVLKTAVGNVNEGIWGDVPVLGRGRAVVVSQQYPHPLIVRVRPAASKRNFTV